MKEVNNPVAWLRPWGLESLLMAPYFISVLPRKAGAMGYLNSYDQLHETGSFTEEYFLVF